MDWKRRMPLLSSALVLAAISGCAGRSVPPQRIAVDSTPRLEPVPQHLKDSKPLWPQLCEILLEGREPGTPTTPNC